MTPEERLRWRLILGAESEEALGASLPTEWCARDVALGFLYDREYGPERNVRDSDRRGGLGDSSLTAAVLLPPIAISVMNIGAAHNENSIGSGPGRIACPVETYSRSEYSTATTALPALAECQRASLHRPYGTARIHAHAAGGRYGHVSYYVAGMSAPGPTLIQYTVD